MYSWICFVFSQLCKLIQLEQYKTESSALPLFLDAYHKNMLKFVLRIYHQQKFPPP